MVESKQIIVNDIEAGNVQLQAVNKAKEDELNLDLAIVLDLTESMGPWITRSKKTIKDIIANVTDCKEVKELGLVVRVAFVGYRDFGDTEHFQIKKFTENVSEIKTYIEEKCKPCGGDDFPEDVAGAF
jgi:hypothetical protein